MTARFDVEIKLSLPIKSADWLYLNHLPIYSNYDNANTSSLVEVELTKLCPERYTSTGRFASDLRPLLYIYKSMPPLP